MYDSALLSEKAILGSILSGGDLAYQRCARLRTEMLSLDSHRRIYDVMVEILTTGSDIDYLILRHALEQKKLLEAVGGFGYIMDLGSDLPRRFDPSTHVELDGQGSLTQGRGALVEKKKSKYRLHDYTERGKEGALGQPAEDGTSAPAVDVMHRLLWLLEHKPLKIPEFLNEAKPNVEQLRLIAQAIGGPALSGGELSEVSSTDEQSALGKLLDIWNAVMVGKATVEDRRIGQDRLFAK